MRELSTSVESPSASPSSPLAVPDADSIAVAWTDPSGGASPCRSDKAKSLSAAMLTLGVALLLFVPVSAVFLLVAGGLGLTIAFGAPRPPSPTLH